MGGRFLTASFLGGLHAFCVANFCPDQCCLLGLAAGLQLGFVCWCSIFQVSLVKVFRLFLGEIVFVVCLCLAAVDRGVCGQLLLATCGLSLVLAACRTRHPNNQVSFLVWLLCFVLWVGLFGLVCLACRVVAIGHSRAVCLAARCF